MEPKEIAECRDQAEFLWAEGILLGTPARASHIARPVKRLVDGLLYRIYSHPNIAQKVRSGFTWSGTLPVVTASVPISRASPLL